MRSKLIKVSKKLTCSCSHSLLSSSVLSCSSSLSCPPRYSKKISHSPPPNLPLNPLFYVFSKKHIFLLKQPPTSPWINRPTLLLFLPAFHRLPTQIRSSVEASTTTMVSHVFCHMSMQLDLLERAPPLSLPKKIFDFSRVVSTKGSTIFFFYYSRLL